MSDLQYFHLSCQNQQCVSLVNRKGPIINHVVLVKIRRLPLAILNYIFINFRGLP